MTDTTTIRAALTLAKIGRQDLARKIMLVAKEWETRPDGWDKKSLKRFWNSIGGSISKCIKKMEGVKAINNPGAFCASLERKLIGKKKK